MPQQEYTAADLPFHLSPRSYARIGGVLYLLIIAIGLWGEAFVRGKLIVSGDAMATAARLKPWEPLWRFGIAAELVLLLCAVTTTWIFYVLLRPVGRDLALLAAFFNLVSMAVEAVIQLNLLAALSPLGSAAYLKSFTPEQLSAMAYLPLQLHGYGFGISLIFFGAYCLVMGYLICNSRYLPKGLGVLYQIGGACYLINSFALILAPDFADRLFPALLVPAFLAELSLALWLSLKGVDAAKWEMAANAGESCLRL